SFAEGTESGISRATRLRPTWKIMLVGQLGRQARCTVDLSGASLDSVDFASVRYPQTPASITADSSTSRRPFRSHERLSIIARLVTCDSNLVCQGNLPSGNTRRSAPSPNSLSVAKNGP